MSRAKELLAIEEAKMSVAEEIAEKAGIIARCNTCGDFLWDEGFDENYKSAYKIANKMITDGDPLVEIFDGNRRELTDMIKDVSGGLHCYCERSRM